MRKLLAVVEDYSLSLILGVVVALIWVNLAPESYRFFVNHPILGTGFHLHFFVNDIFMTFFFAIAAVEIVMAVRPGGDLHPLQKAINPLLATAGGVMGPVAVYFLLATLSHHLIYAEGWGMVTATDIAIAWLGGRLVFGRNHPAVKYLLLLAIADDAVGLAIIAIFYPETTLAPAYLGLCLLGMVIGFVLRKIKVNRFAVYLVFAGVPSWCGLYFAHIEPALALVMIVPFLPSSRDYDYDEGEAPPDNVKSYIADDAMERFYRLTKPIVDYGLVLFGLVNAGVLCTDFSFVTLLVTVSLITGKTVGIFSLGLLGSRIGFPLPIGMGRRELFVVGILAGVGLTVSLFICEAAFGTSAIASGAKLGALLSAVSLPLAIFAAHLLKVGRSGITIQRKR